MSRAGLRRSLSPGNRPQRSLRPSLFSLATFLLASGCSTAPRVFVLHAPVQPNNAQTVTYTAAAQDADGVSSIQVWEDRNTLSVCNNGMQCATHVSTTLLRTCSFAPPQNNATCTFTTTAGYPDGSFIGYRAVARDTEGKDGSEGWIYYAAGAFPWPNNPIPIYGTGAPAEKVDLVFIPDPDYNANNNQFMQDATNLVTNSYLSANNFAQEVRDWRGYWNLYITYQTGDAEGFGSGCNTAPANWTNLRAIVNSGSILHTAALRDCAGIGDGSLFSVQTGGAFTNPTAIHETGHSVFSMADEYCCDGGYWNIAPQANLFSSQGNCQTNATTNSWPTSDCVQIGSTGWWRSDGANDLMQNNNSNTNVFGRSDRARVFWLYSTQCSGAPGCE
ncbi:MAG: hypothetical protein ACR2G6_15400 [Gemmatimonadaceae bacterium]